MASSSTQRKTIYVLYLILTMSWSGITFTVLLPDVKNVLYSKCVWRFNFSVCNRFLGIEGAYRCILSIMLFYLTLSLVTINFHGNEMLWYVQDSIFVKIIFFIIAHIIGFIISFSRETMETLYNIFMFSSYMFIVLMYFILIDAAHAFRMLWLRRAKQTYEPTCYFCTWLFVVHLTTAFLYAMSLDLFLAFFFFNDIELCKNTLLYLCFNVALCFICFVISSSFESLREKQASSQIIFGTVLFFVLFVTWLALSDPDNGDCDMYGTIFTGSLLDSSVNFRAIALLIVAAPSLLFLCFNESTDNGGSFTWNLLTGEDIIFPDCLVVPRFHLIMATTCSYVLMAVTNYYEPVYSIIQTLGTEKRGHQTAVIYFEGENPLRFTTISILSSLLPVLYTILLIINITRKFIYNRKEQFDEKKNVSQNGSSVFQEGHSNEYIEFLYVQMTRKEAVRRLTRRLVQSAITLHNIDGSTNRFLLLPCFYVHDASLSFWHFPKNMSQTYFNGRNGSNACTVIAVIIGRFFSRSQIEYQNSGYLGDDWVNLFHTAIEEGNRVYDGLVKQLGVLDLSIEEVHERLGGALNLAAVLPSLAVSFEADVKSVTILYQLEQLLSLRQKLVVLFIHNKRTSCFLVYDNGNIIYADSHSFGEDGALMISTHADSVSIMLDFLKDVLGNSGNRLATLTVLNYEERLRSNTKHQDISLH